MNIINCLPLELHLLIIKNLDNATKSSLYTSTVYFCNLRQNCKSLKIKERNSNVKIQEIVEEINSVYFKLENLHIPHKFIMINNTNYTYLFLSKFRHLKELVLTNNITANEDFAYLPIQLTSLKIKNGCGVTRLSHLSHLTQLKKFKLSRCWQYSTNHEISHLSNLTQLESLTFNNCCISSHGISRLSTLTQLKSLNLSNCWRITNHDTSLLSNFTQLKSLNLSNCWWIGNSGISHLSKLTQLTNLDLSKCFLINDQSISHLSTLINLKGLSLNQCKNITSQGLSHLSKLKNLNISTKDLRD